MAKAILRKTRETRVRGGHPWLYASEIETTEGECAPGVLPKGVMVMTDYELLMVILTILALLFAVNNKK